MRRSTDSSPNAVANRPKKKPPKARRAYHHGDLRAALVRSARTLLASGGPPALTLRAAARDAGVSQTAPYRHFAGRDDMLAAVAEDGFRRLHARMIEGLASQRGKRALQQIAVEYAAFALENPAEYRVMFGHEIAELEKTVASTALNDSSASVMDLLQGGIEQMQQAGVVRPGDAAVMALSAWALVHGLVMLTLDGQGSRTRQKPVETLVREATSLLMVGMAAPAV
jgi:AcrR family transcriptional regulator